MPRAHDPTSFFGRPLPKRVAPSTRTVTPIEESPGSKWRKRPPLRSRIPRDEKPFIAWDGEGIDDDPSRPSVQNYVLFGCSVPNESGEPKYVLRAHALSTVECLDLILQVEEENPDAIHVGFGFDYDVNQILKDLNHQQLITLRKTGFIRWHGYLIEHRPHKWFRVMAGQYREKSGQRRYRRTATIYDVHSFYGSSFEKAIDKFLPTDPVARRIVAEGKAGRGNFRYEELDTRVTTYWWEEIQLLQQLVINLRTLCLSVDVHLEDWHGPGAIASYYMKKYHIDDHMDRELRDEIIDASAAAYAGGRFELFKVGRANRPVYSADINSAYPYHLTHVPSLRNGTWKHVEEFDPNEPMPTGTIGVYHIARVGVKSAFHRAPDGTIPTQYIDTTSAQPLFFRTKQNCMHYPTVVEGWYWDPEAELVWNDPAVKFVEAWIYTTDDVVYPFAWVADIYAQRNRLKAEKNPAEYILKLAINSIYGKLAQRVGYDEEKMTAPRWHQLEWAGHLTSATRAQLYRAAKQADDQDALIAVETDGIYSLVPLDVPESDTLGDWKCTVYKDMAYIQNGVYMYEMYDEGWKFKYRGLDRDSMIFSIVMDWMDRLDTIYCHECARDAVDRRAHNRFHLRNDLPMELRPDACESCREWVDEKEQHTCDSHPLRRDDCSACQVAAQSLKLHSCTFEVETRRFIGYGAAIIGSDGRNMDKWRHWVTDIKTLRIGGAADDGKRVHNPERCKACHEGLTFGSMMHDMEIGQPYLGKDNPSAPHELKWRTVVNEEGIKRQGYEDDVYKWRVEGDDYFNMLSSVYGAAS